MTQELIERLRRKAGQYDSYDWHSATEVEAADALERLTAERDSLQEGLDGWHARYLDCEVEFARLVDVCHAAKLRLATERDAALAASRHETDMCQQALEDLEKMRGESGVLRGLLNEALGVLETITDEQEPDDWMLLMALKGKIGAAIVPKLSHGQQAANEKQLSVDVDLMARGKKMHFVYPPDAQGDDS